MADASNTNAMTRCGDKKPKRRWWLLWAIFAAGFAVVLGPTILIPAADRLYFAWEERRLNSEFQRIGIKGHALFSGRLFQGTMYITAENIDDSKAALLATIIENEPRIEIADSVLTWQGLQHLVGCKQLKYLMFADTEVSDPDLQALQDAMPNTRISARWRNSDQSFQGKQDHCRSL